MKKKKLIYFKFLHQLLLCFLLLLMSVFLHLKKTIFVETLMYYCFLVFCRIGEYISLDLLYFVKNLYGSFPLKSVDTSTQK